MDNSEDIQEIEKLEAMERYLAGSMSEKEQKAFEERMAKEEDFAEEVALFMDLHQSIQLNGDKELRASIKKVHHSLEQEFFFDQQATPTVAKVNKESDLKVSHKRVGIGRILSIAAGVAVLVGAALFLFQQPNRLNPQEQFAKVYKPETTKLNGLLDDLESAGFVEEDAKRKEALATALGLYEKGEYPQAQLLLKQYLETYTTDKVAQFYQGLCFLEAKEYAKSVTLLQPLTQDKNFELYDGSRWYLSLSYMMLNTAQGKEQAVALLQQILADSATKYKVEAQENLDYLTK